MATIWRARDRLGRDVALTEADWAHILAGHANDMTGRLDQIRLTIEQADFITYDVNHQRRECHYRRIEFEGSLLKVVAVSIPCRRRVVGLAP